ncbi:MAG: hypothetical protein ABIQ99_05470 [Thermoflexales bacterium]
MRTTIDIPDELLRAVKARAALEGRPLKALFLEGLQLAVGKPPTKRARLHKATFPIIAGGPRGRSVTNEIVQKAIDDYYAEEARQHAESVRR